MKTRSARIMRFSAYAIAAAGALATVRAACPHQGPSAKSHDVCSTCTAQGAMPAAANGTGCSYQLSTTYLAFCDCAPGVKCVTVPAHWNDVLKNYSGNCLGGLCVNPSYTGDTLASITVKLASNCSTE